jgi:hypothetical protein
MAGLPTLITLSLCVTLPSACSDRAADEVPQTAPVDAAPAPRARVAPVAYPQITTDGIGPATAGRTVGGLRASLPDGMRLGATDDRFMVDVTAIPVLSADDTLYHLLFGAGDIVHDSSRLQIVATLHPAVRTAEGVGPGMTIAEAAASYGEATLSYSVHDESREYVAFAGQPAYVTFRVQPASDATMFAGIYATSDEFNTTTRYDAAARIRMVMVDLTR